MKTASLIVLGLALVGTATWAMSDTHAVALSSASHQPGSILPYGAMGHDIKASGAAVLPYGAVSATAAAPTVAVTPYGTLTRNAVASTASILPYGAMGPHAAP